MVASASAIRLQPHTLFGRSSTSFGNYERVATVTLSFCFLLAVFYREIYNRRMKKITQYEITKRSIYLPEWLAFEIQKRAEREHRSWASQVKADLATLYQNPNAEVEEHNDEE